MFFYKDIFKDMKMNKFKGFVIASIAIISFQANAGIGSIINMVSTAQDVKEKYDTASELAGKAKTYIDQKNQVLANGSVTRGQANCAQHYPVGAPKVVAGEVDKIERRSFFLCREGYAVQFDPQKKTPLWASEYLSASLLRGGKEERTDDFRPDPAVPNGAQATLNDYRGSKFDRGHVVPAADMNGRNANAMSETFFLTNMVPQVGPNNNRGIWADLEGQIRKWAMARGKLHVLTGPIFSGQYDTMGRSGVAIPTHLYKVVLDPKTSETIAFIIPNVQVKTAKVRRYDEGNDKYKQTKPEMAFDCNSTCGLENFVVRVSDVEKATGLKFFSDVEDDLRTRIVNANPGRFSIGKSR